MPFRSRWGKATTTTPQTNRRGFGRGERKEGRGGGAHWYTTLGRVTMDKGGLSSNCRKGLSETRITVGIDDTRLPATLQDFSEKGMFYGKAHFYPHF